MRNSILVLTVFVIGISSLDSSVFGQTGAAWGGGGGSATRSTGSGFSSRRIGGVGGRRLGRAERRLLRQQQLEQRQAQTRELLKQQTEAAKARKKQELIRLGLNSNGALNRRQFRRAFGEAKDDYQALRQSQISPEQLGFLGESFRLRSDNIDRKKYTANWPTALLNPEFETQVKIIDAKIMAMSIRDAESAGELLNDLNQLNTELNIAAANGDIGSTQFARSRRFITGLANEIRSSNLVM